jgi:tungstate transport system substrate-binding protein
MVLRALLHGTVTLLVIVAVLTSPVANAADRLRLATTTSTENSGLLSALLPIFEAQCDCRVDVIAVGTGQALALGERGDVDVVLVHAPGLEQAFVQAGHGVGRRTFMQNDYVVVGPSVDPAAIRGSQRAQQALVAIHGAQAAWISRGDHSGTHQRELDLWAAAGLAPTWTSYQSAGQGMAAVLTMASEKRAYTLTDRGTWLALQENLALEVLASGDPSLVNPYSVIAVNPQHHPWVQAELASQLIDWLCEAEAQRHIGAFRINGQALFVPLLLQ